MKDSKDNSENAPGSEKEIKIIHGDHEDKKEKPVDDGFKTSEKKYKQEWTQPLDEQQFDDEDLSEKDN